MKKKPVTTFTMIQGRGGNTELVLWYMCCALDSGEYPINERSRRILWIDALDRRLFDTFGPEAYLYLEG